MGDTRSRTIFGPTGLSVSSAGPSFNNGTTQDKMRGRGGQSRGPLSCRWHNSVLSRLVPLPRKVRDADSHADASLLIEKCRRADQLAKTPAMRRSADTHEVLL